MPGLDPDWFSKSIVDDKTTMLTEPFVHAYVRANIAQLGADFVCSFH